MIGDVLFVLVVGLVAGGVGLWFGIVVLTPRLRRGLDRADEEPEEASREPEEATTEPDGRPT